MTDQPLYRVMADGVDISATLVPILISLKVQDTAGTVTDSAEITIDDTNGRIAFPRDGARMTVDLGWRSSGLGRVFEGTVTDVRSNGARDAGRRMTILAKGADMKGKAKQGQEKHWDRKTLGAVMTEAAGLADLGMIVDPSLTQIERKYWSMNAESFMHFGYRIAREVGATFKIVGRTAVMARRNAGLSASGRMLGTVTAAWGDNLIAWEISPVVARPRFKAVRARWFDMDQAMWRDEAEDVDDAGALAKAVIRFTKAGADEARRSAGSGKLESERQKGGGTVRITGNVLAQPEGICVIAGARPGVDGTYRVDTVVHELSRPSGFTTTLHVKHPGGGAGRDGRA
jgi:phage protein D